MTIQRCWWVVVAVAMLGIGGCAGRTKTPELSKDQEMTVRSYLTKDCGTGDSAQSLGIAKIRLAGISAYAVLWDALRHGPSEPEQATVRETSIQEFTQVQRLIAEGALDSFKQEEGRKAATSLTRDGYVAMSVESFGLAYRERALNALISVQPPGFEDSLRNVVKEPTLPPNVRKEIEDTLRRR